MRRHEDGAAEVGIAVSMATRMDGKVGLGQWQGQDGIEWHMDDVEIG